MRAQLLALILCSIARAALGQMSNSSSPSSMQSTMPATIAGQSATGSTTAGQNLTTTTAPAPATTIPPINPEPSTTPTLSSATGKPARKRGHTTMGTSNSFQNGVNGVVNSNDVANGVTSSTPAPLQTSPQPSAQPNLTNKNPANRSLAGSTAAGTSPTSPGG